MMKSFHRKHRDDPGAGGIGMRHVPHHLDQRVQLGSIDEDSILACSLIQSLVYRFLYAPYPSHATP